MWIAGIAEMTGMAAKRGMKLKHFLSAYGIEELALVSFSEALAQSLLIIACRLYLLCPPVHQIVPSMEVKVSLSADYL